MTTSSTYNIASLKAYSPTSSNPWDLQKIHQLYRRLGFGATPEMVANGLNQNPLELIDQLIDEAINMPPTKAPDWGFWVKKDFDTAPKKMHTYRTELKNQMVQDFFTNNLRDRLTLFWSNHFVTEETVYRSPAYMYQYYHLLQFHAIGNFKQFAYDIGLNPAMLIYLNNFDNNKKKPNENYAREFLELFTLGIDNGYTQTDIIEISRAFTGWNKREERWGPIVFDPAKFDDSSKTIFEETGNWGYDDVIDILFKKRKVKIAEFICTKLYRHFVSPEINTVIITQLAQTFVDNDFEISPVLKRLFKSEHFFNDKSLGLLIKSPIDIQLSFFKELNFEIPTDFNFFDKVRGGCKELTQELFNPIDVGGWQEDKDWVNSSTIARRWDRVNWYLWSFWRYDKEQFRTFATYIMGGNSKDVALVSRSIIEYFLPKPLFENFDYEEALEIFKNEIPENHFEDGLWDLETESAPSQVAQLLAHIIKIPEFQLK